MKTIALTRGRSVIIDDQDYSELSQYKWVCNAYGYACRSVTDSGKRRTAWMHREINKTPDGLVTDHINGNTLDNRRRNLRSTTHKNNIHNSKKRQSGTSQYKGVYWFTPAKQWCCRFVNQPSQYLIYFDTELEAAYGYNIIAFKEVGKYARLNDFPEGVLSEEVRTKVETRIDGYLQHGLCKTN